MIKMQRVVRRVRPRNKNSHRSAENAFEKRIVLQVTHEIYDLVKLRVETRNTSMRRWITRAINRELQRELDVL